MDPEPTPEGLMAAARVADFNVLPAFLVQRIGINELPTAHYLQWVGCAANKVNGALFPKVFETVTLDSIRKAYVIGLTFGLMEAGQKGIQSLASKLPDGMPVAKEEQAAAVWQWFFREDADKLTPPENGELIPVE